MCGIVSATTMAYLSIASAAVGLYATHETAVAQTHQLALQQKNERQAATDAATEQLGQRVRASRESRARALVAGGESGALGQSFAVSLNQSLQDQDYTAALVQKNLANQQRAIDDRANTARSQIRDPSALEAGLTLANAGISGYNTGLSLEAARKGSKT